MPIATIKNIKTTSFMINEITVGWYILAGYVGLFLFLEIQIWL
jgi:hypothetical protein